MSPDKYIEIFHDTQKCIAESDVLQSHLLRSQSESQLFLDHYTSPIRENKGTGEIEIVEGTSFSCAEKLSSESGKIAVLNFANPHEPGGGVLRGATAQEECLCRSSFLYHVLAQPYFLNHYYRYHYENCDNLFSDRLIYSPKIIVFKSDDPVPQMLDTPFPVDVITASAPYIDDFEFRTEDELTQTYQSRIKNILEVAMSQHVDYLILGAFGCGAFHNNPSLMAKAFAELLIHDQYAAHFKKVIFAIKKTSRFCPNLYSFRKVFQDASGSSSL